MSGYTHYTTHISKPIKYHHSACTPETERQKSSSFLFTESLCCAGVLHPFQFIECFYSTMFLFQLFVLVLGSTSSISWFCDHDRNEHKIRQKSTLFGITTDMGRDMSRVCLWCALNIVYCEVISCVFAVWKKNAVLANSPIQMIFPLIFLKNLHKKKIISKIFISTKSALFASRVTPVTAQNPGGSV